MEDDFPEKAALVQGEDARTVDESVATWEREAALERVLSSSLLIRSARLRRFLSYVVEESVKDSATALTEQRIGVALFDRRPSYDTGADNIVRVNATELRKRLEQFYAGEGATDSLIIEIPRGSYKPVFTRRISPVPILDLPVPIELPGDIAVPDLAGVSLIPEILPPEKATSYNRLARALAAALAVAVAAAVLQTYRLHGLEHRLEPWRNQPALQALWQSFFGGETDTTIVLADTSFAMAQDVSGYRLTLDDYQRRRYSEVAQQYAASASDGKANASILSLLFSRYSGSIGDFYTARHILALNPASPQVRIQFARDFTGETLRHASAVLLGSTRSNPWVEPFQSSLFYHLQNSPGGHSIEVHVDSPQAGEKAVYATSSDPNRTDGFCIIALLPSLSGPGKTLIIAGTDSQATEAGGDFVTQEVPLEQLQSRLGASGFKDNFQVLLRTSRTAGSPLASEIISVRAGTATSASSR